MIIHLNRGCEGFAQHQMQMKLNLQNICFPVMAYEGIIADEGQFDERRTKRLVNLFIPETLDLKKVVVD